jgi:hypothetical protein
MPCGIWIINNMKPVFGILLVGGGVFVLVALFNGTLHFPFGQFAGLFPGSSTGGSTGGNVAGGNVTGTYTGPYGYKVNPATQKGHPCPANQIWVSSLNMCVQPQG